MENNDNQRILGIDTGTNSLGWAVVDRLSEGGYQLIDKGVNIFQEGVNIEKGTQEKSRAAERTEHRSLRKQYWRRKVRKINLLRILSQYGFCPHLSNDELKAWRMVGKYPLTNEDFMRWQRTDENKDINPYAVRCKCVEQTLDMNNPSDRYIVGRALYHICQRRGFLSNRKDQTNEDDKEAGKVKNGIKELTQKIQEAGCEYMCQYFYQLYHQGKRIRNCYTDRKEHYLNEFEAICQKQNLNKELVNDLRKVIFEQRPLKSQRRGVAKCPFEPTKHCAPISHPLFEEFRMWSFIRNVKMKTPTDADLRPLTADEVNQILPLWFRKSKPNFKFEDIAKTLAGKGNYCYYKSAEEKPYRFNYHLDTNVAGCPVSAQIKAVFGDNILNNRTDIDKIWQALDFFDDDSKLREWGIKHFNLTDEQTDSFIKIHLPQGYASLSLKAMENIVPLMREHSMMYPEATLVAKLRDLTKNYAFETDFDDDIEAYLKQDIADYLIISTDKNGKPLMTREERRKNLHEKWKQHYHLSDNDLKKLYHPSMIEQYRKVEHKSNGVYQLGSPRISALKNPMAMRSLFRMKAVINQLLKDGTIDENTIVHIEFARELNDANHRAALRQYQKQQETERAEAKEAIKEYVANPSPDDINKYLLWLEQDKKCVYTNKSISLAALYSGTEFDIEHTIPRSMGGDTTRENLTICDAKFNREVKKNQLPSQLSEQKQEIIQVNIKSWKEKYENLDKQIRKLSTAGLTMKEAKDRVITKRHLLEMQREYWKNKYNSFVIEEKDVQGFTRRQKTDISVISRYGRLFLQSLFNRVDVVKGTVTAEFRKAWGLQNEYEKKDRTNHVHHCIDAITIACMGKREYDNLSASYRENEKNKNKIHVPKPWQTFTEDIKDIKNEILVAHYTSNPMGKQTKKTLRDSHGHILRDKQGQPHYIAGDTARGALHMDTQYGAIKQKEGIKYVLRMAIDDSRLKVENIVDPVVRHKVQEAINHYGSIANALEAGPIWMNEEKKVAIKKVRVIQDRVQNPMHIRIQRDLSKYEYKRQFHVKNDTNYLVAIYQGDNPSQRSFKVVSNLEAAKIFNKKQELVPLKDENKWDLINCLKIGDMVLLYENSPEELKNASQKELVKHLFKIVGLALSGGIQIKLNYHQEARPSGDLHQINGPYMFDEPIAARRMLTYSQFNALVQGQDFEISETGKITFK